jgi:hypothetical protein
MTIQLAITLAAYRHKGVTPRTDIQHNINAEFIQIGKNKYCAVNLIMTILKCSHCCTNFFHDIHFRRDLINADSLVILDMLTGCSLTSFSQRSNRTCIINILPTSLVSSRKCRLVQKVMHIII